MYCKNCGAYIEHEHDKCAECGAIDGLTPIMMIQKRLNGDVLPDYGDEENSVQKEPNELFPEPPKAQKSEPKVEAPVDSNRVEDKKIAPVLPDLDDSFDIFGDDLDLDSDSGNESVLTNNDTGSGLFFDNELDDIDEPEPVKPNNEPHNGRNGLGALTGNGGFSSPISSGNSNNNFGLNNPIQPERNVESEPLRSPPISSGQPPISSSLSSGEPVNSGSFSGQTSLGTADAKPKKQVSGKLFVTVLAIVILLFGGYIAVSRTGVIDDILGKGKTTTTTLKDAGYVTTEEPQTTTQVNDSYPYAEVIFTTESTANQAASGIINSYQCGVILFADIDIDAKITLKTDEYEIIFRSTNSSLKSEDFVGKSVVVIGSALYDTISAETVYLYEALEPTTEATTTAPKTTIPDIPEPVTDMPDKPYIPEPEPTVPTTTKRATTTANTLVSVQYITENDAKRLMTEWRADGTKLGNSNAYFGTIKSVSTSGTTVVIKTSQYQIMFETNDRIDSANLVGKNVLAVAKPQSNGTVKASKVYIY